MRPNYFFAKFESTMSCFSDAVAYAQHLNHEVGIVEVFYEPPVSLTAGPCEESDVQEQEGFSYFCGMGMYAMYNDAGLIQRGR